MDNIVALRQELHIDDKGVNIDESNYYTLEDGEYHCKTYEKKRTRVGFKSDRKICKDTTEFVKDVIRSFVINVQNNLNFYSQKEYEMNIQNYKQFMYEGFELTFEDYLMMKKGFKIAIACIPYDSGTKIVLMVYDPSHEELDRKLGIIVSMVNEAKKYKEVILRGNDYILHKEIVKYHTMNNTTRLTIGRLEDEWVRKKVLSWKQ